MIPPEDFSKFCRVRAVERSGSLLQGPHVGMFVYVRLDTWEIMKLNLWDSLQDFVQIDQTIRLIAITVWKSSVRLSGI